MGKLIGVYLLVFSTIILSGSPAGSTRCCGLDTLHISQCKNLPLSSIDTSKIDCPIAKNLIRYTSYIEENEIPCSTGADLMVKRYQSFADTHCYKIDYTHVQWFGDTGAPVSVIMYISMSCPLCKVVYQQLYDTLRMDPALRKKMRLGVKYRSTSQYDKILAATAKSGKQPLFLRHCSGLNGRVDDIGVKQIAGLIDVSYDSLVIKSNLPEIDSIVNRSNRESISNGVKYTPAIFINRRQYYSTKNADWIIDAALYHYSTIPKKKAGK